MNILTKEKLQEVLSFDYETGEFKWKNVCSNRVKPYTKAGSLNHNGYLVIGISGKKYFAHNLAWLYVYGEFPLRMLDHVNRNRQDNRICNLRIATTKQNNENISLRSHNTSGHRGVTWHKAAKKWMASVTHNKKQIYLGLFEDVKEAALIAESKRKQLFSHL
jgi:hypothetical protein